MLAKGSGVQKGSLLAVPPAMLAPIGTAAVGGVAVGGVRRGGGVGAPISLIFLDMTWHATEYWIQAKQALRQLYPELPGETYLAPISQAVRPAIISNKVCSVYIIFYVMTHTL